VDTEEKRKLAKQLLELKHDEGPLESDNASALMASLAIQFREKQRALMLELYLENYSEEQLLAEIAFYTSEVGESILRVKSEIAKQLRAALPELVKGVGHSESSGSGDMKMEIRRAKLSPEQAQQLIKDLKLRGIIPTKETPDFEDDE